mmetsp:Transcript_21519/g.51352  ORF Transcript_21519/g.51352 Transcript_21519/m.51352 type:complete len:217 (-) Transcript_21519:79-729(-)
MFDTRVSRCFSIRCSCESDIGFALLSPYHEDDFCCCCCCFCCCSGDFLGSVVCGCDCDCCCDGGGCCCGGLESPSVLFAVASFGLVSPLLLPPPASDAFSDFDFSPATAAAAVLSTLGWMASSSFSVITLRSRAQTRHESVCCFSCRAFSVPSLRLRSSTATSAFSTMYLSLSPKSRFSLAISSALASVLSTTTPAPPPSALPLAPLPGDALLPGG